MTDGVTGGGGLRLIARLAGEAGREVGRAGRVGERTGRAEVGREGEDGAERTRLLASTRARSDARSAGDRCVGAESLPGRLGAELGDANEGGSCERNSRCEATVYSTTRAATAVPPVLKEI